MSDSRLPSTRGGFAIIGAVYVVLVAICLWRLNHWSSVAGSTDVSAYLNYAMRIRDDGLAADIGTIRTYGYPLFLAGISFFSGRELHALALAAGLAQAALWGGAVAWLVSLFSARSLLRLAVAAALLLHPYTVSVLVDAVTEGLSLPLTLVTLAALICVSRANSAGAALMWFAVASLAVAVAFMVRPANIVLFVAFAAATAVIGWRRRFDRALRSFGPIAIPVFVVALAFVIAPQVAYNLHHLDRLTPFPVCPIGSLQLAYGILSLKYDTLIVAGGAAPLYFPNPYSDGLVPAGPPWTWYLQNPVSAFLTAATRAVAGLSLDHLFVYRHDDSASWVTTLVGWLAFGCALATAPMLIRFIGAKGTQASAVLTFTAFLALLTWAISTTAAVETRMNLMVFVVLGVMAVVGMLLLYDKPFKHQFRVVAAIFVIAMSGMFISLRVNALESRTLPHAAVNAERLTFPCSHSLPGKQPGPTS